MRTNIELVRKHGSVKVRDMHEGKKLQIAARKRGLNFGVKKSGWSTLVIDLDG